MSANFHWWETDICLIIHYSSCLLYVSQECDFIDYRAFALSTVLHRSLELEYDLQILAFPFLVFWINAIHGAITTKKRSTRSQLSLVNL